MTVSVDNVESSSSGTDEWPSDRESVMAERLVVWSMEPRRKSSEVISESSAALKWV